MALSVLGPFSRLQTAAGSLRRQLECPLALTMRIRGDEEEKEPPHKSSHATLAENLVGMQIQGTPSFSSP